MCWQKKHHGMHRMSTTTKSKFQKNGSHFPHERVESKSSLSPKFQIKKSGSLTVKPQSEIGRGNGWPRNDCKVGDKLNLDLKMSEQHSKRRKIESHSYEND